ncbi:MAG: hypothetical protein QXE51_04625 [Nitrososphaeria archaeon]
MADFKELPEKILIENNERTIELERRVAVLATQINTMETNTIPHLANDIKTIKQQNRIAYILFTITWLLVIMNNPAAIAYILKILTGLI